MKVDICSRDMGFLRSCRTVLELWGKYVCVAVELTLAEHWDDLRFVSGRGQSILFLDADQMDTSLGAEKLEIIRADYGALFVFVQDSRRAIDLYRLRPTSVLNRCLSAASLDQAMSRCIPLWQSGIQNLELTENRSRLKLPMCDILWVEAQGRSSVLHCLSRDVQIGESMNELIDQLAPDVFIRCQRSYLVNLHHVRSADGKFVYMTNGETIPVGRSSCAETLEAVEQYRSRWNERLG